MNKKLFTILLIALPLMARAQNLQLNYDFGRRHLTSTLEMYKTDKFGATYAFIDLDYNRCDSGKVKSASLAYGEIARYFKVPKLKNLSATIQYNDGLTNTFSFNPVWLGGAQYVLQVGKQTFPVDFLVRKELNTDGLTFQLTYVWYYLWRKLEISGFVDIWSTGADAYPSKKIVILSEPQFWYKLTPAISIGGEIEISRNFSGAWSKKKDFAVDEIFVLPTLGLKWVL
ncbi:MAG: DUF5020 family protein [Candidatus Neomarinimicrobiota bacterium]